MAKSLNTVVTVEVTKNDIKEGVRMEPRKCVVARAAKRVLKKGTKLSVDGDFLNLGEFGADDRAEVPLTKTARRFIRRFDDGAKRSALKPFKFTLRLPKAFVR